MLKEKTIVKLGTIVIIQGKYRGAAHSIFNSKYSVTKEIPIVFHNYHFIIKELAEKSEKQFTCLGENTEKYINFSVPIQKEVIRIDKNGENNTKNIYSRIQLIDNTRFMTSSLSVKCKLN